MQLRGKVVKIHDIEKFSDKFEKQVVLVEQEGVKYDATVPLELINDKISDVGGRLAVGETFTFSINISGREWKDKHFVSLRAWKCEVETGGGNPSIENSKEGLPF